MTIMNIAKEGADLTHPKMSIGWVLGAFIAAILLGIVLWMYRKAKSVVSTSGMAKSLSGLESQAEKQLEGFL